MKSATTLVTAFLVVSPALCAAEPITNSIGMKLVPIQPDTFTMDQDRPPTEDYLRQRWFEEISKDFDRIDFDEKPAHKVTITQPFLMGVPEVTVTQFRQFDPEFKKKDPKSMPADDDAARGVTWERAVAVREWHAFVFWALTGRTRNSRFPPLSGVFWRRREGSPSRAARRLCRDLASGRVRRLVG